MLAQNRFYEAESLFVYKKIVEYRSDQPAEKTAPYVEHAVHTKSQIKDLLRSSHKCESSLQFFYIFYIYLVSVQGNSPGTIPLRFSKHIAAPKASKGSQAPTASPT